VFLMNLSDDTYGKLLNGDNPPLLNVGTGEDVTIRELATLICDVLGFEGELAFDPSKPDGTPRKLLDVSRINALGWKARTGLAEGIRTTYESMREQLEAMATQ
jgi:GDP-L-fucose synthase